jgi:Tol biopolymer transport system component
MAVSIGDRIGRFEILGWLGAGGMGEVYRARDHQLSRDVAVKVLPAAFLADPDRQRRFEQEARAAGGLNHPNILAVFDIGIEQGSPYIVTELLEGETLRDRMGGRPLAARKAVEYALQIANGLAAAHDRGVVHRDIKPGNLFITTDGRVKILDFGLAKLTGDETLNTETITVTGMTPTLMGTVAYMSPEQATGLRVDHRTDIFSFGVVLYEMLSGVPPFRRVTPGDTLNAILHDEPAELPRNDPAVPALERIVFHCLEKKPEERFQNLRDLSFHLESRPQTTSGIVRDVRLRGSPRGMITAAAIAALLAAAVVGGVAARRVLFPPTFPVPHRVLRVTNFVGLEEFSSVSPDGRMVAFTAVQRGRRQVFIQLLKGGPPHQVTDDAVDHQLPRWSPDGNSLVYFSPAPPGEVQGAIYKIPMLGGSLPQRVIGSIGGGDVSRTGRVACFRLEKDRIQLVTSTLDGADVQVVTTLETRHYRYPRWSPDNEWIAFQTGDGFRWDIHVVAARGGAKPVPLATDNRFVDGLAWLPDSRGIVYASSRGAPVAYLPPLALWQVMLDGQAPRQLTPAEASYQQPDIHESGLVSTARVNMRSDVWSYPFGGSAVDNVQRGQQLTRQTGQVLTPTAAPDGDQIAYLSDAGGHANIWVISSRGQPRQVTFEDDPTVALGVPIWSPDGRWIAYVSSRGNSGFVFGIWIVRPDGSDARQLVPRGLGAAWSPDSKDVYFVETAHSPLKKIAIAGGDPVIVRPEPVRNVIGVSDTGVYFLVERALVDGRPEFEIRVAPLGDGPTRVIKTIDVSRVASWQVPFNPALSLDGKWLAMPLLDGFTSNIWALSTDDGRWQQVTDFGDRAIFIARRVSWSSDGRSILAAIGEGDADIVLLDGLIKGVAK